MKVAVIGANGQLGRDVCEIFKHENNTVIELLHNDIEISNIDSVSKTLTYIKPDIIVNTAAMHNVEKCEADPVQSFFINAIGAKNLAIISQSIDAVLIHISTDYVFNGSKQNPYTENDSPSPINTYGNSKLAGEYYIQAIAKKYFILRTSGLYGKYPCRAKNAPNFVELMIKLSKEKDKVKVVDDEILTPTSTLELSKQILVLSKTEYYGLYHATAEGSCSWYEFANEIFSIIDADIILEKASESDFPHKVPRPKYSVLENFHLKQHNLNIFNNWKDSLRHYLEDR